MMQTLLERWLTTKTTNEPTRKAIPNATLNENVNPVALASLAALLVRVLSDRGRG